MNTQNKKTDSLEDVIKAYKALKNAGLNPSEFYVNDENLAASYDRIMKVKPQDSTDKILRDLLPRLAYNVMVKIGNNPYPFCISERIAWELHYGDMKFIEDFFTSISKGIKAYLRPFTSITRKEQEEIEAIEAKWRKNYPQGCAEMYEEVVDYYIAHHIDYRNLIKDGLAIAAPKDMYTQFIKI